MKLRIWDEKYNCWEELPILAYPNEEIKKQGCIISFCTGYEDRHGNMIWQGDILEIKGHSRREKVIFLHGSFGLHLNYRVKDLTRRKDNDPADFAPLNDYPSFLLTRIGSYYENPSLLEQQ
jgi:hypothetical protein